MSNDVTQPAATVIDTPEGISMVTMLSVAHALALEINMPGMKVSRVSSLAVANRNGYTLKRTKKGALKDVVALIKASHPDPAWAPSASVARALAS